MPLERKGLITSVSLITARSLAGEIQVIGKAITIQLEQGDDLTIEVPVSNPMALADDVIVSVYRERKEEHGN